MKNTQYCFIWIISLCSSLTSFGQGTVNFNNDIAGVLVTHVYGQNIYDLGPTSGNGSNDTPSGTAVYTGSPIGGTSSGFYAGPRYTAQLWALAGSGHTADELQPVSQYTTTFRTASAGAGFIIALQPIGDPGIPNTGGGGATLQLRVWDNQGGSIADWNTANHFGIGHGASPTFDLAVLGTTALNGVPMIGLQSFTLDERLSPPIVPEPQTLILITVGAGFIGMLRRPRAP